MAEFDVAGNSYRSGKLDAFSQFHVVRKLGPIFVKLGPSVTDIDEITSVDPEKPDAPAALDFNKLLPKLGPVFEALQEMSEVDCNFVFEKCLSVVSRSQNGNWMHVWNKAGRRLQFEDIGMPEMLQITMYVLGDNLTGFFTGAPPTS